MFARRLAIGVRSSWLRVRDQVALRLDRALERVERGVEAARESSELVVALDSSRSTGPGCRQRLGTAREARIGASAARATTQPSPARAGCRCRRRRAVRPGARAARGRPRSAAARPAQHRARRQPDCEHAQVHAADVSVAEEAADPARCGLFRAPAYGREFEVSSFCPAA